MNDVVETWPLSAFASNFPYAFFGLLFDIRETRFLPEASFGLPTVWRRWRGWRPHFELWLRGGFEEVGAESVRQGFERLGMEADFGYEYAV